MARVCRIMLLSIVLVALGAQPAGADPAGPTNYLSTIESVTPATTAFHAAIVGGDSFVLLEQLEPVEIEVPGYNEEPYLRYLANGTVERNVHSPATYLNSDRYGTTATSDLPSTADATAEPEWEVVATDGVYAWHDHRAHWMLSEPPLGLAAGDQILDETIPVIVGAERVELSVVSYWQPAPSPLAALAGAVAGVAVAVLVWRYRSASPQALGVLSVVGVAVGAAQFQALPSATDPSLTLLVLPVLGLATAAIAWVTRRQPATKLPLLIGGAASLIVFFWLRRTGLTNAVLPTDLPFWIDRFVTALVGAGGVGVLVAAGAELRTLLAPPVRPTAGSTP